MSVNSHQPLDEHEAAKLRHRPAIEETFRKGLSSRLSSVRPIRMDWVQAGMVLTACNACSVLWRDPFDAIAELSRKLYFQRIFSERTHPSAETQARTNWPTLPEEELPIKN